MPVTFIWPLSFRFLPQNPVCDSPPHQTYHVPHSFIRLEFITQINLVRSKIMKLIMQSPPVCYLAPLKPKHLPQHPIPKYPQSIFYPQCKRPGFIPTKKCKGFLYNVNKLMIEFIEYYSCRR